MTRAIVGILLCASIFVSSLSYAEELGYYIPWLPLKYTYKDYKGKPDIDDPAFEEISKQKKAAGECELWPSKYMYLSDVELEKLLAKEDADALFEMHLRIEDKYIARGRQNKTGGRKYLDKAAKKGHVVANLKTIFLYTKSWNYSGKVALLEEKYSTLTPLSQYVKVRLIAGFDDLLLHIDEINKLAQVGGYPSVLSVGAVIRYGISKDTNYVAIDKDAICEGYFYGCLSYNTIKRIDISCGGIKSDSHY